jgi:hypothetical protein
MALGIGHLIVPLIPHGFRSRFFGLVSAEIFKGYLLSSCFFPDFIFFNFMKLSAKTAKNQLLKVQHYEQVVGIPSLSATLMSKNITIQNTVAIVLRFKY